MDRIRPPAAIGIIFHPKFPSNSLAEYARKAEAAGFAELWLWDDCFLPGAFTSAAIALSATQKLKVGIGLLPVPAYNPLFAAMEIAGVPLAVLDEVDAALDEVNLRRFAVLAKEYSRAIQIVAMTHRRYTMEQADLLYGVTMSEPGLSQVVGVRLEDWT